jgi:hypothetical protein
LHEATPGAQRHPEQSYPWEWRPTSIFPEGFATKYPSLQSVSAFDEQLADGSNPVKKKALFLFTLKVKGRKWIRPFHDLICLNQKCAQNFVT